MPNDNKEYCGGKTGTRASYAARILAQMLISKIGAKPFTSLVPDSSRHKRICLRSSNGNGRKEKGKKCDPEHYQQGVSEFKLRKRMRQGLNWRNQLLPLHHPHLTATRDNY